MMHGQKSIVSVGDLKMTEFYLFFKTSYQFNNYYQ